MPLVASDHTTNVCLLTSWDPSELTDRDKSHEFKSFDRVVLYRTLIGVVNLCTTCLSLFR